PAEDWSAVRHQVAARAAVAEIEGRGKRALLVGGTGLYLQAVVDDLRFPAEDPDLRAELEAWTAEPRGVGAAYDELRRRDPEATTKIDPHNARRIVRALEVIRLTGKPFSSSGPGVDQFGSTAFAVRIVGVWIPRGALNARIAARFAAMRHAGLLEQLPVLVDGSRHPRAAPQRLSLPAVPPAPPHGALPAPAGVPRRQPMWCRRGPRITGLGAVDIPGAVLPTRLATWDA